MSKFQYQLQQERLVSLAPSFIYLSGRRMVYLGGTPPNFDGVIVLFLPNILTLVTGEGKCVRVEVSTIKV